MRCVNFGKLIGFWFLALGYAYANQPFPVSPDGRYTIAIEKNTGLQSYHVNLINAQTNKVIDSYNPETRAIEVFWNPTSNLVAINEYISIRLET